MFHSGPGSSMQPQPGVMQQNRSQIAPPPKSIGGLTACWGGTGELNYVQAKQQPYKRRS
ncbi:hypothetical protein SODALDRAFT_327053 [Sodiomyces alkalinus F11]|uniref:Uncharacterized protein n=1 Tax=Sodiomyces alkalinus (strain CBS 110278 / VKM F-3762 / F11) TaxID=1314773 RepID=A0A3N2Q8E7_SODAK|nr:hypothetical protein SODALDRAFT_327053 [Sodiomyces alkalinus F11]ROT42895.1 hypothetical protein SODALDRAFT_327053 [Sodiomyces alkalinus F11]